MSCRSISKPAPPAHQEHKAKHRFNTAVTLKILDKEFQLPKHLLLESLSPKEPFLVHSKAYRKVLSCLKPSRWVSGSLGLVWQEQAPLGHQE